MCCVHAGVANNKCSCGARQLTLNATTVGQVEIGYTESTIRWQCPWQSSWHERRPCDTISGTGTGTAYEGSQNQNQTSLHRYYRAPFLPPLNAINLCACAHAIFRQPHMFSFVIKMFDNFIRDPSANKGPEIVSAIYMVYAICCWQSKWHTLNLSLIQHPSNPREMGSLGVFDYKHVGFMDSSFGVSHSFFSW